jgi:riboflavin synthase
MFTGIVERVGTVRATAALDGSLRIDIATGFPDLVLGESVAVNGVCLTVVERDDSGHAAFFVSAETLRLTNLRDCGEGVQVNLERAVTLATRLSGHMVQGHVDGLGRIASIAEVAESRRVAFSLPGELRLYCVAKGSITLDGTSLTLNEVGDVGDDGRFEVAVNLIPHTWDHTRFSRSRTGDAVNVEVDVIAKYVEQLCHGYLKR